MYAVNCNTEFKINVNKFIFFQYNDFLSYIITRDWIVNYDNKFNVIMDLYIYTTNNKVNNMVVMFRSYGYICMIILHVPETMILVTIIKRKKNPE